MVKRKLGLLEEGRENLLTFISIIVECTSYVCLSLDSFQQVNKNWVYTDSKFPYLDFKFLANNKIWDHSIVFFVEPFAFPHFIV